MLLNEMLLCFGCTIKKKVALLVYCFRPHRVKWNKICKKSIYHVFLVWMGKCTLGLLAARLLCFTTPSGCIFASTPGTHESYLYSRFSQKQYKCYRIHFAQVEWNLSSFSTKAAYLDALSYVLYRSGTTHTDAALDLIQTTMLTAQEGDRHGFNNVIVVITDGQSHNPAATLLESNQTHNISGDAISIGIGNS